MPRSQLASRKRPVDEQIDEDYSPWSSQSTQQSVSLRADELECLVNDCVYYLLISHQKKLPAKKADVVKHVLKEKSKSFSTVIQKAENILKQVYGIKLVEVEGRKGQYILVNNLKDCEETVQMARVGSDTENARDGLLILLLTLIYMNGNVMSEAHMWQALKRLGAVTESAKPHPFFGDVKKLITQEFVRQLYLEYTRISGSEPPSYEFRWGFRSFLEVDKKHLLQLVCSVYNNEMKMDQWMSQYQDMMQSRGNSQSH